MTTAHGYYVFTAGQQPTEDQTRGYVGEQIIARDTYANLTGISSPPTGLHGWATDKKILIVYSGSAWVAADVRVFTKATLPTGVPVNTVAYVSDAATLAVTADGTAWTPLGVTSCTNATRPTVAFVNQVIFETDTFRRYYCSNATGPTWTAAGGSVYIGSAPGTAVLGDVWVDTSGGAGTARVSVCTNATGPVWTSVNARTWTTGGRPSGPLAGEIGYNSSLTYMEYYNGSTWAAVGAGAQMAFTTDGNPMANGSTNYVGMGGTGSSEIVYQYPMATACSVTAMYVSITVAPGSGKSRAFTVRKNGSDTAVTCTVSDLATTANDTSHSVSFAAGDLLSISGVPASTPASASVQVTLRVAG